MNRKGVLVTAAIAGASLAIVVTIFTLSSGSALPAAPTGPKLADKTIEAETQFKEIKKIWREHERDFADRKEFKILGKLNTDIGQLKLRASTLKGASPEETAALPHLLASIEACQKAPSMYILHAANPKAVKQEDWDAARAALEKSNAEWALWIEKSKNLKRQ